MFPFFISRRNWAVDNMMAWGKLLFSSFCFFQATACPPLPYDNVINKAIADESQLPEDCGELWRLRQLWPWTLTLLQLYATFVKWGTVLYLFKFHQFSRLGTIPSASIGKNVPSASHNSFCGEEKTTFAVHDNKQPNYVFSVLPLLKTTCLIADFYI